VQAIEDLPDDKKAEAQAFIDEKLVPAMSAVLPLGALGSRFVWIFVLAGLGFGVLRGTNKELRFKALLGAVALASAPLVLHDVLGALVYLVRDVNQYDAQNPVLSNPAAWMRLEIDKDVLGAALLSVDLFSLWTVYLCGLALAVVSNKRGALPWLLPLFGWLLVVGGRVVGAVSSSAAEKLAS
jgi:hypothetical protein